jgi:hypothetical protein
MFGRFRSELDLPRRETKEKPKRRNNNSVAAVSWDYLYLSCYHCSCHSWCLLSLNFYTFMFDSLEVRFVIDLYTIHFLRGSRVSIFSPVSF